MRTVNETQTGCFEAIQADTGTRCELAMQELWLTGKILPLGARLVVRHVFESAEPESAEIVYSFGLPRDAALRQFRVTGPDFSVRSELRPTDEAREAYEQAIEEGHLGALTQQYRDGVINLSVGNVRPGEQVKVYLEMIAGVESRDDGFRFRFPFALAPSYHPRARTIEARPGEGEMELPPEEFGDVLLPVWTERAESLHAVGFDLQVVHPEGELAGLSSPTHPVRVMNREAGGSRVSLGTESDVPNRDFVLDAQFREPKARVFSGLDVSGRGRFGALVPSTEFGESADGATRVAFAIDTSGSMRGKPIQQALRSVRACLGALSPDDRFGIVTFDSHVSTFRSQLIAGDAGGREGAETFLEKVQAGGGTELLSGLTQASGLLGEGGGDILLVTDGQVSGTDTIVRRVKSAGIRVHCLGIGSASQDRFLASLARETGGVSRFLTPRERVDMAAVELFSAAGNPLATELSMEVDGLREATVKAGAAPAVFEGTPVKVFGQCEGTGEGALTFRYEASSGSREITLPVVIEDDESMGENLRLLQASRLITELETELGAAEGGGAARRRSERTRRKLERLSLDSGLSCQLTSLVAVVEREGDAAGEVPKTRVVPVGMPQDTAFEAYFSARSQACASAPPPAHTGGQSADVRYCDMAKPLADAAPEHFRETVGDVLLEVAGRLEPDGGLPGDTEEERIAATLAALLLFISEGHSESGGAFARHVRRMKGFLESADLPSLPSARERSLDDMLRKVTSGETPGGDRLALVKRYLADEEVPVDEVWDELARR